MKMKAACYCRVSTKKDDQLESLEKQQQYFRSFFDNNNEFELYDIYVDEGISGKSLKNRKEFNRMIKDAQNKKFSAIFVKDVSRLARNAKDFFNTLSAVDDAGVSIYFTTLNLKSERTSTFMLGLLALVAEEESAKL